MRSTSNLDELIDRHVLSQCSPFNDFNLILTPLSAAELSHALSKAHPQRKIHGRSFILRRYSFGKWISNLVFGHRCEINSVPIEHMAGTLIGVAVGVSISHLSSRTMTLCSRRHSQSDSFVNINQILSLYILGIDL